MIISTIGYFFLDPENNVEVVYILLQKGQKDPYWGRGGSWVGHFNDDNSLKGLRSIPNFLCGFPLNDSLVSFVIIILNNEFCSLMLSYPCFRWHKSLHLLP